MTKICKRCGLVRKKTSFRMLRCRNGGRGDVCRTCYDTNQLEEWKRSPEQINAQREKLQGRKYSLEHRIAISKGQKKAVKDGRHHWKKNEHRHPDQDRTSLEYKIWKEKVFEIRGKKCDICERPDRLHIHHIKSFYDFPELKFDPKNGQVLCISCHMMLHRAKGEVRR